MIWPRRARSRSDEACELRPNRMLDQPSVAMDAAQTGCSGPSSVRLPVHRMTSGAGHDAMIVARRMPAAMLFLRSPGGISHHPDETVLRGGRSGGAARPAARSWRNLEERIG